MAGGGLLALLDDITAIADDVAALADDVSALTLAAGRKTTGLVTDDMAVTAEQTTGLSRDRELPVVWAVAKGSLFNKAVLLAPGALLLYAIAPWAIGPLLMAGGLFLCFEGVEKILHKVLPHDTHAAAAVAPTDPVAFEQGRIAGAIRTDLILSAEIVAITLGEVTEAPFLTKALVLYTVSVLITVGVYGLVAVLVKLDDAGEALVRRGGGAATVGRLVVRGTPWLMRAISVIGTVAMLLVGGHILVEQIGPVHHAIEDLTHAVPGALSGTVSTLADLLVGAVAGLVVVGAMATGIPGRLVAAVRGGSADADHAGH